MALPPIHGQQNFRPGLETGTGGAYARKFKSRKKETHHECEEAGRPNAEALASLAELKKERGFH